MKRGIVLLVLLAAGCGGATAPASEIEASIQECLDTQSVPTGRPS